MAKKKGSSRTTGKKGAARKAAEKKRRVEAIIKGGKDKKFFDKLNKLETSNTFFNCNVVGDTLIGTVVSQELKEYKPPKGASVNRPFIKVDTGDEVVSHHATDWAVYTAIDAVGDITGKQIGIQFRERQVDSKGKTTFKDIAVLIE